MWNLKKPDEIVKLESFIAEKTKELRDAEDKQHYLKCQRGEVAFQHGKEALEKLDASIKQSENDYEFIETQLEGARKQIKTEVDKWIRVERERLTQEAEELYKQAEAVEAETNKHIEAIEKLHGQAIKVMYLDHFNGSLVKQLQHRAKNKQRNADDVWKDIEKLMKEAL